MKIMPSSFTHICTNYVPSFTLYCNLAFVSVFFLFFWIIPPLFFLGRSMGYSLTSTMTTSHSLSLCVNFLFPGIWNGLLLISHCSTTVVTMRQYWASLITCSYMGKCSIFSIVHEHHQHLIVPVDLDLVSYPLFFVLLFCLFVLPLIPFFQRLLALLPPNV